MSHRQWCKCILSNGCGLAHVSFYHRLYHLFDFNYALGLNKSLRGLINSLIIMLITSTLVPDQSLLGTERVEQN